jgi:hypothetical protein
VAKESVDVAVMMSVPELIDHQNLFALHLHVDFSSWELLDAEQVLLVWHSSSYSLGL